MKKTRGIKSRVIACFMALLMLIVGIPITGLAAPASDIPSEMLNNDFLDALAYTGYNVQGQKNDGTIFKKYSSQATAYGSNISYGLTKYGTETVANSSTKTGRAPDIAGFESSGLCCASYVSYVYYNYLPNIKGIDTSSLTRPTNTRLAQAYEDAANKWVAEGKARRIAFTQNSAGALTPAEKIPIGSIITFKRISNGTIGHVAIYAGEYAGKHFTTHVGTSRGPEITLIDNSIKGDEPKVVSQIVVPSIVENSGKIEVYKKDTNGTALSGAYFTATNTATGSQFIIGPTNNRGYAVSQEDMPYGSYKVVETVFPKNYTYSGTKEWNVTISSANDGIVTIQAVNQLKKGHIEILKSDAESGKDLSGAEFTVYDSKGTAVTVIGPTNANGYAKSGEITYGSYTVKETKEPTHYYQEENKSWSVTLNDDSPLITLDIANLRKYGSVKITKTAEDSLIENLKFELTGTSVYGDEIKMEATTNAIGEAIFPSVPIGTDYTIREINTPARYVIPQEQHAEVEWNLVCERGFHNALKKWRVDLFKLDSELDTHSSVPQPHMLSKKTSDSLVDEFGYPYGESQGDASLAGAVYGVYRYDKLIDTYTTDKNGYILTDYYVCGEGWNIREITPSEGYLLDTEIHWLGMEPEHFTIEYNTEYIDVQEDIIKGKIALIKHMDNGDTQIETPEARAEFEVYLKSSGTYQQAKETERAYLETDEHGYAETDWLPYGIYTVKQVAGAEGKELMPAFDVYVSKHQEVYRYLINNAPFTSYVKVEKTDAESGRVIPYAGSAFQIYRPDGSKVSMQYTYPEVTVIDTFYTNEKGYLITPEELDYGKGYSLVEVQAPYGYVLDSDPIRFDITDQAATSQDGITVVKVTRSNMPQKGIIQVTKTGEVFQSVVVSDNLHQPVYEIKGLSGAVFEIRAAEDIYTLDGTMHYAKSALVDTITTGSDGVAKSKELYLGKYEVTEIQAPYGMVLNNRVQSVELIYAGQDVKLTQVKANLYNDRQKVKVSLQKELETDEIFGIGNNRELEKITFGLYAGADITAADGSKILKGGLIEIITFGADGQASCNTDLPFGTYYIQELTTDNHYVLDTKQYSFTFAYQNQNEEIIDLAVNNGNPIINKLKYGRIVGLKLDEDGSAVAGSKFGLFSINETEYDEEHAFYIAESQEDGTFEFNNIPYGTWNVKEIKAPLGFVLNQEIYPVTISEDGDVIRLEIENRHIYGTVHTTKIDKDYPDNKLTGAIFEIYMDIDGNKEFSSECDALIGEMTEYELGLYQMENLRYGGYFLYEKQAPENFRKDDTYHYFEIQSDGEVVEVENEAGVGFVNVPMKGNVKIIKTSSDGKVEGFSFRIQGKDYDEILKTDASGIIFIEGLRVGKYTIEEVEDEMSKEYKRPEKLEIELADEETLQVEVHNERLQSNESPKTGDSTNAILLCCLMGGCILYVVGMTIYEKKKGKNQK